MRRYAAVVWKSGEERMTVDETDSDKMAKTGGRLPNFSWSGPNRIRDLSKILRVVRSTEVFGS
jgi:hypothetical protein